MSSVGVVGATVLALSLITAAPVLADAGIGLAGQAALVCSAGISGGSTPPTAGAPIDLGQLAEFCNDPDGYDVWIDYPASLANGSLVVNGQSIPLTAQGTVLVSHTTQAGQAAISLTLNANVDLGAVPLTVRMVPANASSFALALATP